MITTVRRVMGHRPVRLAAGFGILAVAVATVAHAVPLGGDFRLAVWFPGQAMFHGRDPYDVATFEHFYGSQQVESFSKGWFPLYGPVHLWLAVLFGLFPVKVAAGIWFVLNLGALGLMATVAARALDRRLGLPAFMAITGFLVLSRPGRATLETGQATVIYALLTYVAWSQVRRRPWLAALALAAALGKPPFGLPLLVLILVRGLWPVAVRALALFVAASLPIMIWLSVNAGSPAAVVRAMVHNLRYTDHNPLDAPGSPGRIDGLSLIARYAHGTFGGGWELAAFVVIVGVAAVGISRASRGPGWALSPAVVMVLGLATLLSLAHENYDLLLLAWPFAAAMRRPYAAVVKRIAGAGAGVGMARAGGDSGDATRGPEPPGGARRSERVLAVTALPALIVSVIPANDTLKVLGLGSGSSIISTLTTACLLAAMVGALVAIGFGRPEVVAPSPSASAAPGPVDELSSARA